MVNQYYFSGTLPEEDSTYVMRTADDELYEGLKAGKFCYVLNSSQSGKSSLRVRTMRRLREDGVECAAIDLTSIGTKGVLQEQWYIGLVDQLIGDFGLDVKFKEWWEQNHSYSVVSRFRKFFEEILLNDIKENIVIFIDEIGSILSLNFPTDDFFTFIRYCYNQRIDNSAYDRLTFCFLGIASPSDLIQDKELTSFNIGKAIFLQPFQLDEVGSLEKGLQGRYPNPRELILKILQWTGGQPFLTQKLCHFMVQETQEENPRTVEQVVRDRMIENWEFQDDPQHLRTIRGRILNNKNKQAHYLLGLYQRIWQTEEFEIVADDTPEQYDLQLSGLVVRQKGKLRVYNQIYQKIFDKSWVETQLWKLCPYAENLQAWVASEYKDKSRLLRGKSLEEAQEWLKGKSLSDQHSHFLLASENHEEKEKLELLKIEAELEHQRRYRETAEQINRKLAEANKKAKRRILLGSVILSLTLLAAFISLNFTFIYSRAVQKQGESISQIKRIFYTDLENLLKNKNWQEADKLTSKIIWELAGTWQEPSFRAEDSRNFPCEDLRNIDDLWTKYSNQTFGFSVQSTIWREVNGDIIKFMSRVRWGKLETQEDGKVMLIFLPVTDYSLNALKKGQLPWSVTWYGSDGTRDRTAYLNRVAECFPPN